MSTIQASNLSDGTDSVPMQYPVNGSAKAWASLNGVGTIALRDSLNVSSVTDNAVGDFTYTWSSALANVDYAALGAGTTDFVTSDGTTVRTTSALRTLYFNSATGGGIDSAFSHVAAIGDLAA